MLPVSAAHLLQRRPCCVRSPHESQRGHCQVQQCLCPYCRHRQAAKDALTATHERFIRLSACGRASPADAMRPRSNYGLFNKTFFKRLKPQNKKTIRKCLYIQCSQISERRSTCSEVPRIRQLVNTLSQLQRPTDEGRLAKWLPFIVTFGRKTNSLFWQQFVNMTAVGMTVIWRHKATRYHFVCQLADYLPLKLQALRSPQCRNHLRVSTASHTRRTESSAKPCANLRFCSFLSVRTFKNRQDQKKSTKLCVCLQIVTTAFWRHKFFFSKSSLVRDKCEVIFI